MKRLDAEFGAWAERHRGFVHTARLCAALRWAIVPLAGLLAGLWFVSSGLGPYDLVQFADGGERLFSRNWLDTFADGRLQAGPLLLALHRLVTILSGWVGAAEADFLSVLTHVAIGPGTMLFIRGRDGEPAEGLQLLGGLLAVFAGPATLATLGHPAEVLMIFLWLASAEAARRGAPVRAGILLGLSSLFKVWGLVGAGILAGLGRGKGRLLGPAVAGTIFALVFAPFVLLGEFRMQSIEWLVAEHSLVGLFVEADSPVSWSLRLFQAAASAAAGGLAGYAFRKKPDAVWAAAGVALAARLLLDPVLHFYYWMPLAIIAVVGASRVASSFPVALRLPVVAMGFLLLYPQFLPGDWRLGLWAAAAPWLALLLRE